MLTAALVIGWLGLVALTIFIAKKTGGHVYHGRSDRG